MPLFDRANPVSDELAVAVHLADLISEQSMFQELAGVASAAAALEKIVLAVPEEPIDDGNQFSETELEHQFLQLHIWRVDGSHIVKPGGFDRPDETGDLHCHLRRYVRDTEERQDVFLFFWDRTSRLVRDLQLAIETLDCPRLLSITETSGPYRNSYKTQTAQGNYIWTNFVAKWGDAIDE